MRGSAGPIAGPNFLGVPFICFQTQNAATTNRAIEINRSEARSCITASPNPLEKAGPPVGADGHCRAIKKIFADRGDCVGSFGQQMRDGSTISQPRKAATKLAH
jgi:hypothetical protein